MSPPIVALSQVSRQIGELWLLRDICLDVSPGDRIGIHGESGSGKTLLMRTIGLLDPISSGEVRFHGKTIGGEQVPRYRRQVIYVHQRPSLFEGTVESNLWRPFELSANSEKSFDRDRVTEWLGLLGRDGSFLRKPSQRLSGGEAQLTALIRAIQLEPQILLLDEPTAALDSVSGEALERLLDRWINEADERAFILVSHDPDQLRRQCRSRYRMQAGMVSQESAEWQESGRDARERGES